MKFLVFFDSYYVNVDLDNWIEEVLDDFRVGDLVVETMNSLHIKPQQVVCMVHDRGILGKDISFDEHAEKLFYSPYLYVIVNHFNINIPGIRIYDLFLKWLDKRIEDTHESSCDGDEDGDGDDDEIHICPDCLEKESRGVLQSLPPPRPVLQSLPLSQLPPPLPPSSPIPCVPQKVINKKVPANRRKTIRKRKRHLSTKVPQPSKRRSSKKTKQNKADMEEGVNDVEDSKSDVEDSKSDVEDSDDVEGTEIVEGEDGVNTVHSAGGANIDVEDIYERDLSNFQQSLHSMGDLLNNMFPYASAGISPGYTQNTQNMQQPQPQPQQPQRPFSASALASAAASALAGASSSAASQSSQIGFPNTRAPAGSYPINPGVPYTGVPHTDVHSDQAMNALQSALNNLDMGSLLSSIGFDLIQSTMLSFELGDFCPHHTSISNNHVANSIGATATNNITNDSSTSNSISYAGNTRNTGNISNNNIRSNGSNNNIRSHGSNNNIRSHGNDIPMQNLGPSRNGNVLGSLISLFNALDQMAGNSQFDNFMHLLDNLEAVPVTLDPATVDKLPVFKYKELKENVSQLSDPSEKCSVCLEEFKDDDELRVLFCKHFYHKKCIDTWLTEHSTTCPLCRTDTRE